MKKASIAVMVLALALLLTPVFTGHASAQIAPCATVNDSIDGTEAIQTDRITRNGTPSTCANKAFPGLQGTGDQYYETFTFGNTTGADTCFNINFLAGSCGSGFIVHASAYLNSYIPENKSINFLGDQGTSGDVPFDVTVPAGQNLVVVVNTNFGLATCSDYSFTITAVDANSCGAPNVISVPATNQYGMAVFAVLAAIGSILVIRRKITA